MSAYLCADDTFDYLATAARLFGRQHSAMQVRIDPDMPDVPELVARGILAPSYGYLHGITDTDSIAQVLRHQNVRSVAFRYDDPDDMGLDEPYRYRSTMLDGIRPDPVTVLKSIACLRYQSCETEDYERTLAWRVLDTLREYAIDELVGYRDAPWGWERPDTRRYTLNDGNAVLTFAELAQANRDDAELVKQIDALALTASLTVGGGAAALMVLTRLQ